MVIVGLLGLPGKWAEFSSSCCSYCWWCRAHWRHLRLASVALRRNRPIGHHHWPPHQRPRSHGPATAVVSTKDNCCEVGASAMCTAMGGSLRCDRPATLSGEFNNSHHYTAATQACITLLGYISPFPANITIVLHFVLRFFALRNTMTYLTSY